MEFILPHRVVYNTDERVPVGDVIESLRGTEIAAREAMALLPELVDGLSIRKITVNVQSLSQESPLRELFLFSILVTFQDELTEEIPPMLEKLLGVEISEDHDTMVTVVTLVLLFYGAEYLFRKVASLGDTNRLKAQMDGLISELSGSTGKSEEAIRRVLAERYSGQRLARLSRAAVQFFRPSKGQNNAAVEVGHNQIPSDVVSQVPGDIAEKILEPEETSEQFQNVEVQLHAQDVDRAKSGWAAVIPSISDDRIKMRIFPPTKPEDIWTRQSIRGDVVVVYRTVGGEMRPYECHLVRLIE